MKQLTKLFTTLALLFLLLVPASSVRALGPFDDGGPVIFGGSYTLASGDTLTSDLVVFGGNVTIEADSTVQGSIVIFGGTIRLDGTATGDLVLIGGSGSMGEKSVISGDLVTVGASVSRAEGSTIVGTVTNNPTIQIPVPEIPKVVTSTQIPNGTLVAPIPGATPIPPVPNVTRPDYNFNPFGSAFSVLGTAIMFAAFAMLLVLFLHPQMDQVAGTIVANPLMAAGVGLLALPATLLLMLILLLTILGPLVVAIAFFAAWLFGVVSIGNEVGERLTRSFGQEWAPALTAGFGTFLVVLIAQGIGQIPCLGWAVPLALGLIGLGGVVLTVFSKYGSLRQIAPPPGTPVPPSEPLPPPA